MSKLVQLELNFKRYFVRRPGTLGYHLYQNSYIELDGENVRYFFNDGTLAERPIEFLLIRLERGTWVEVDSEGSMVR